MPSASWPLPGFPLLYYHNALACCQCINLKNKNKMQKQMQKQLFKKSLKQSLKIKQL